MSDIVLEAAERVFAAARSKAVQIKALMDIAIVDSGSNLKTILFYGWTALGLEVLIFPRPRRELRADVICQLAKSASYHGCPLFGIEYSKGTIYDISWGYST